MRLLFICGRNQSRSPTAEHIFSGCEEVEVRSAGVSFDADQSVSFDDIEWADIIFVMESKQRDKLQRLFASKLRSSRVVCLGIPDQYEYLEPELIRLLWERVPNSVSELIPWRPSETPPD